MLRLKLVAFAITLTAVLNPGSQVHAQELCETIGGSIELYESFIVAFFEDEGDIDIDGLNDHASLRLVEAVACLSPATDLYDATNNAYLANLAVFDLEPAAEIMAPYRELIAVLMLIGGDMQANIIANTEEYLSGTYVTVECAGADCVPDAVPGFDVTEVFEVFAADLRSASEPYTALGDLDLDGVNNLTEFNNVMAAGGFNSDFVIAATSPNLNGTETLRTAGSSGSGSACFIATAAYGTPMAEEIDVLRDVRDTHLLNGALGTAFVDSYYRLSPPIADVVAKHPMLQATVRAVLTPIIWMTQSPWLIMGFLGLLVVIAQRRRLFSLV